MAEDLALDLMSIVLPIFFVDGMDRLQLQSMGLVRAVGRMLLVSLVAALLRSFGLFHSSPYCGPLRQIFRRFQDQRAVMLEDLLHSFSKLPTAKRGLRKYHLRHTGGTGSSRKSIQMVTALFLQCIQCCSGLLREVISNGICCAENIDCLSNVSTTNTQTEGKEKAQEVEEAEDFRDDVQCMASIDNSFSSALNGIRGFVSTFLRRYAFHV